MSVRTPLSDHQIERLLLARSAEVDIALLSRIQHVTERLPQRHAGWFPLQPQFDRRMLTLVAVVALLLAALAGAISLAGRTILPEPEPVRPDPIDELMGQFVASGLLRIDAGGGELGGLHRHRENAEPGTSVEVSFGRLIEGAAGPDHDGTPVTIAGYDGWLRRDSTSPDGGRLREFVLELDKERWWLVIYLQTGPRAPADDIADVMRLLASIRPAQGD
jgi:hypothetical protein